MSSVIDPPVKRRRLVLEYSWGWIVRVPQRCWGLFESQGAAVEWAMKMELPDFQISKLMDKDREAESHWPGD